MANIYKLSFDSLSITENYFSYKTRTFFESHNLTEIQNIKPETFFNGPSYMTVFYGPGLLYSKYGEIEIRVGLHDKIVQIELNVRSKSKFFNESIDAFHQSILIDFKDYIQEKKSVGPNNEIQIIEYSQLNHSVETIWDKEFPKEEKLFWNLSLGSAAVAAGFLLPFILKVYDIEVSSDIKDYISIAGKIFVIFITFEVIHIQRNRSVSTLRFRKTVNLLKNINSFFSILLRTTPFLAICYFTYAWFGNRLRDFDFYFFTTLCLVLGTYVLISSKKVNFNRKMFDEPEVKNLKTKNHLKILELSFTIAITVMSLILSKILFTLYRI